MKRHIVITAIATVVLAVGARLSEQASSRTLTSSATSLAWPPRWSGPQTEIDWRAVTLPPPRAARAAAKMSCAVG